jgi:hypothetical protein
MSNLRKTTALVFLTFILLFGSAAFAIQSSPSAEIKFLKSYSGSETGPTINKYIQYDVSIKNTSNIPITNQSLWVSFTSEGGKTDVYTSFHVQNLLSGDSKLLHVGPFKMRESGQHSLYLGMNRDGNSSLQNDVSLNYEPNVPVDRFQVSETTTVPWIIPGAFFSIIVGVAILASFVYYRKKRFTKN